MAGIISGRATMAMDTITTIGPGISTGATITTAGIITIIDGPAPVAVADGNDGPDRK